MRHLFRLPPLGTPDQYKSHSYRMPLRTHTRIVDCQTYGCEAYAKGWGTVLDVSRPEMHEAATWIMNHGARHFTHTVAGTIVTFNFPAGQMCFAEHRVPIKPGVYTIRDGDWRGNPTGRKATVSERAWVDDLGEQTEKLAEIRNRG